VIRTLFAFAERTKMDSKHKGPHLEFEKDKKTNSYQVSFLLKNDLHLYILFNDKKNMKRKASIVESIESSGINTIFANLMQVKTKTS
jgi:hypothetical protein